jgi:hypothetical protein
MPLGEAMPHAESSAPTRITVTAFRGPVTAQTIPLGYTPWEESAGGRFF